MNDTSRNADETLERMTDNKAVVGAAWALVTVPLAYGVVETLIRVANLF